jgi:putative transposase
MTTTKKTIALAELAEKGADADLLREMIQYVAQRMMDLDIESWSAGGTLECMS